MRSPDGQVYCVGCESWIFPNQLSPKKQRFGELVPLQGKQNIKLKHEKSDIQVKNDHSEVAKINTMPFFCIEKNIRAILEKKLIFLTNLLDKEVDINKIK